MEKRTTLHIKNSIEEAYKQFGFEILNHNLRDAKHRKFWQNVVDFTNSKFCFDTCSFVGISYTAYKDKVIDIIGLKF